MGKNKKKKEFWEVVISTLDQFNKDIKLELEKPTEERRHIMEKERKFEEYTLVLIGGDTIELNYPVDISDEFFIELQEMMNAGKIWNVGNWVDVNAAYLGNCLNSINMKLVIGTSQ